MKAGPGNEPGQTMGIREQVCKVPRRLGAVRAVVRGAPRGPQER